MRLHAVMSVSSGLLQCVVLVCSAWIHNYTGLCAAWQDHLLASLSQGQPATPNPFSDLVQWFPTACQAALVALLFVLLVVPQLGPTEAPHQHRGAFISPLGTPAAYEMLLQGCSNGTCMLNASTITAFSAMDTMTVTEASNTEPTSRSGSAAEEPERSQDDTERQGLFSKLLGASSWSVRSSSQKSGSEKSDPTATASKEEPKGAVAATDLEDIDIEGGIEALLFLLEAAKKSKARKQAVNGEEYEATEAADS